VRLKIRRGYWRVLTLKLHPGKAFSDSYTPQLLKLQVLLLAATAGLGLAGIAWRPALVGAGAALLALGLSTLPFVRSVRRRDRAAAVWAAPFIVARSAAFALGIIGGLIGLARFRPTLTARALAPRPEAR
jgi:hypothetical protein